MPAINNPSQKQLAPEVDAISKAVEALNAGWQNSDYSPRPLGTLGRAQFYRVAFKGQDGKTWYENYAYRVGVGKPVADHTLDSLLNKANSDLFPAFRGPDKFRLVAVVVLAAAFSAATIVASFVPQSGIETLSGAATLLIGYLVGKDGKGSN